MRILFFVTAHNSLSQRVFTALSSDATHGHELSVEYATSEKAMIDAVALVKPDIILCPFLTRKVPQEVYEKYLTLIVHPGAPGDAGPSALDWVLMGDTGSSANAPETLAALASALPTKPRSHWAVTVLQAEEEFDQGPIWAWEQFTLPAVEQVNGSAHTTVTKAALYRGQVTRAALVAVLAALDRIEAASVQRATQELSSDLPESSSELPSIPTFQGEPQAMEPLVPRFPVDLQPPAQAALLSVSLAAPFLGLQTQHRPLLRPAERAQACDPRVHSAAQCATVVRAGDSQPGVLVRWLDPRDAPAQGVQGRNLFIYGAWVEENRLPAWTDDVPVGKIVATRDGAVLIKSAEHGRQGGYGLWLTHVRVPLAKGVSGGLNPKLPAVDGLRSAGLGAALESAREWNVCGKTVLAGSDLDKRSSTPGTRVELGWEKRSGTWQQTWVEFEELRDGGKAAYVYFDYYNGACTTYQCEQLLRALRWAVHPDRGDIKVLVLMGGSYFSNGIALNTIEGSEDPSLESWKNINAINDVVEFVISDSSEAAKRLASNSKVPDMFKPLRGPSLVERGIVTVAAIRSNVAAGGLALATAADIVLCSESAVINPHYRGVGLYGSEFHTYSFYERAGETKAREALRGMLPMSAAEACQVGFVDEVMSGGDSDGYVECTKAYVRALAGERASAIMTYRTAPWTRAIGEPEPTESLLDVLVTNKLCTHAAFDQPLVAYRHAELSEMLLDFYHPVRSKRYSDRRRAFVRKLAPQSTPLRFATHRRTEGLLDEEETDEFDAAPGWEAGSGVEWGWVGSSSPPGKDAWAPGEASPVRPPKSLARPMLLSVSPSSSISASGPSSSIAATPGLSTGSSLSDVTSPARSSPPSSVNKGLPAETRSASTLRPVSTATPPTHDKQRARLSAVKMLRRKSDAGVQIPKTEVPPVPLLAAPDAGTRPLRRSRSSIEWGSREINAIEHGEKKPATATVGRLSRWIKAIVPNTRVSPKGISSSSLPPVDPNQKKAESGEGVKIEGEKQEILYPCYYNGNNE